MELKRSWTSTKMVAHYNDSHSNRLLKWWWTPNSSKFSSGRPVVFRVRSFPWRSSSWHRSRPKGSYPFTSLRSKLITSGCLPSSNSISRHSLQETSSSSLKSTSRRRSTHCWNSRMIIIWISSLMTVLSIRRIFLRYQVISGETSNNNSIINNYNSSKSKGSPVL